MDQVTHVLANDAQHSAPGGMIALKDGVCMGLCSMASAIDLSDHTLSLQRRLRWTLLHNTHKLMPEDLVVAWHIPFQNLKILHQRWIEKLSLDRHGRS